ncbi:trypsin-like serine peptidase [Clavibacter michiganensis]|uniref:trypsin-like serine peptidase n=1 Tax=Clavibacter michiganensis TaxID=28447 RepID=UPI003EBF28C3
MHTHLTERSAAHRRRGSAALRLSAISAISAACVAASLAGTTPSAWAADATAPASDTTTALAPAAMPLLGSADAAAQAVAYWTPARIAAASVVGGQAPASTGTAERQDHADEQDTADSGPISVAQQVAPVSHIGRLFYNLNGQGYACSANVVEAANRSTVATAGHCMTGNGAFATDSVLVPGYHDGGGDYGRWPVVGGYVAGGFTEDNGDAADDVGFVVVARNDDGDDIESVVGASPVLFDQSLTQEGSVYGYPAEGRFDGESLQRCTGRFEETDPQAIDLPCDMTGGVSGGPIFAGDEATGAQYAEEDARYEDSSHIIGPIWQGNEHTAYDLAAAVDTESAAAQG